MLSMKNISKHFPGVYALKNVDFHLKHGEIHAILGENGAGKSTLIKILGGIYRADGGEIWIDDRLVNIESVQDAEKNGIAIIHQELVLVPHMSVAENIFLGKESGNYGFVNITKMKKQAQAILDELGMNIRADAIVKNLSIAEQQMVEITKAISLHSRILVMDEPTSSISEREVEKLFRIMRNLADKGVGIIYISHKMSEINEICDRVSVMRDGEYVDTKVVAETTKDELISLMVGRKLDNYYVRDFRNPEELLLRVSGLSDGKRVKDVSFDIRRGEIVGFAGLVGAGRSETMQTLFGLRKKTSGEIYFKNEPLDIRSPQYAMERGIAFVPENRKEEGLFLLKDVRYNTTIEVLKQFISRLRVQRKKEYDITQKYIDMMSTKTPSQNQIIANLSGGNQQKVLIGRWLATDPKVLILDEPTRGVDVGAKSEIYSIMNELAKNGVSIIMISSELPEIINMSDRVYVMANGEVRGCLNRSEISQESIMHLATI